MPLGILLKNENRGDEMVEIMSHHQYVPSHQYIKKVFVTGTGQEVDVSEVIFKKILFGGDQLTATRGRSAKRARSNSLSSITRLDGLEPNASDFHVQLNLLDVSYLLLLGSVDKVHTTYYCFRLHGSTFTPLLLVENTVLCISCEI